MRYSTCLTIIVLLLFLFILFPIPCLSLSFNLQKNFTLLGEASFTHDAITLTQETRSSNGVGVGVGRALYSYPIRFLDPSTNSSASFSSRFSFTITPSSPSSPFGDGLAFLITSNATSLSTCSGYLALPNPTHDPQQSFIAVEFDTAFDPSLGDINDNHIALDVDTPVSYTSVDALSMGVDLKSGQRTVVWVEYQDSLKLIRIWVSHSQSRPPNPLIATHIDLSLHFNEFMHMGFSASSGPGSARHLIHSLRFTTFAFPPTTLKTMDTSADCLICLPGDSNMEFENGYVHNPTLQPRKTKLGLGAMIMGIVFGGSGGALLVLLLIVFGIRWCKGATRRRFTDQRGRGRIGIGIGLSLRLPTRVSLAEIKSATRGFHQSRIIGEGGSGTVYKGVLPSGKLVAIKRFSQIISQVNRFTHHDPFTNELAAMLGCVRHKHLVQLLGWCCEDTELVLVYEYMSHGSLEKILHNTTSHSPHILIWEHRLNILLGVASALTYLHEECERQIIHRDVKACNIMLDADFNAKLGDFDLAELYERTSGASRQPTIPAGTMGYLAPEYVHTGVPTDKTDVYSFGVLVLEVATGRWPIDGRGIVLVDWVWEMWSQGRLMEAVDDSLIGRFERIQMEGILMVGLSCVHPNCAERPTMRMAEKMLRQEAPFPILPSKKPEIRLLSFLPDGAEEILRGDEDRGSHGTPWSTPQTHFS